MEFVYVSSVEGRLVPRFPTVQMSVTQHIGATRYGKQIAWDTSKVVAIPQSEWNAYRREYKRRVADGSLTVRTRADFEAQCKAEATPPADPPADTSSGASVGASDSTPGETSPEQPKKKRKAARAAGEGDKA